MGIFSWLFGKPKASSKAAPPPRRPSEDDLLFQKIQASAEKKRQIEATRLDNKDEYLAEKIKKLLLDASFHETRNQRAFENVSQSMKEIGETLRADGGQPRWMRIRDRVAVLCADNFYGLSGYYDLLGPPPAENSAPVTPPQSAGSTKPVFRIDDGSSAASAPGVADEACILFGPHAEEGVAEAMEDEEIRAVIVAKGSGALERLPDVMKLCTLNCRYPTENVGGLRASDQSSVEAWQRSVSRELSAALAGSGCQMPMVIVAPEKAAERLILMCLWGLQGNPVSKRDVVTFAKAVEKVLWNVNAA